MGAAAGCGSSPGPASMTSAEGAMTPAAASPSFAVAQHVAAGTDFYACSYWAPSATDTFLVGASHVATSGAHHVHVFRTDLSSLPDGAGAPGDCFAGPTSPMAHMRGEVYGSQARTGSFAFPAGVGLPLRGGEVLLVQVHFLDAGAQSLDARVDVALTTARQGVDVSAGVFFFDDPFIAIPPGASSHASMRCLVPNDVTFASVSSYNHTRAQSVTAFLDPPSGALAVRPFYASLDAANPLSIQSSLPIAAGSRVRFTCAYQNLQGTSEVLQGLDYQADELCILSGTYYPASSSPMESCALAPDDFGTGTATCAQTLACVNACPPGTAPPADLGLSTAPHVDPCWQRCVVASCRSTSALLFALERCSLAHCVTACGAAASAECAACQMAQCATAWNGCAADVCGG